MTTTSRQHPQPEPGTPWDTPEITEHLASLGEGLRGKPLLLATLDFIERHPEVWTQKTWVCNTGGCFAGNGAILAGAHLVVDSLGQPTPEVYVNDEQADLRDRLAIIVEYVPPGGDPEDDVFDITPIHEMAQAAMGLTDAEVQALFHAENTLDDLRAIVRAIVEDAFDPNDFTRSSSIDQDHED